MYKAQHPRVDVDRLYVSRKGGRALVSVEDNVDASIQRLKDYTEKHGERLITDIRNNTDNMWTKEMTLTGKQKWEENQVYRRFKRLTRDITHEKKWMWLRKQHFKRET